MTDADAKAITISRLIVVISAQVDALMEETRNVERWLAQKGHGSATGVDRYYLECRLKIANIEMRKLIGD